MPERQQPPSASSPQPRHRSSSLSHPFRHQSHPLRRSLDGSVSEPFSTTDVFSDEFSVTPADSFPDGARASTTTAASNKSSRSAPSIDENGLQSHLSPFRDSLDLVQREMSQRPHSPQEPAYQSRVIREPGTARGTTPMPSTTPSGPAVSRRSISTSSRFSIPRALSPYIGQTGPSHPYTLYPQGIGLGRTPSISTISTIRAADRNTVGVIPPLHPYTMYPQNTVPEESVGQQQNSSIPLGFPGHGQPYQRRPGPTADDLGDIVGPDGHTEQLPPYSRYPDGMLPKPGPLPPNTVSGNAILEPDRAPVTPDSAISSRPLLAGSRAERILPQFSPADIDDSGRVWKEKWTKGTRTKVCGGIPIWVLVLIGVVLIIGAVIGGVIGGILGAKKGEKAGGASASSAPGDVRTTSVVTVTSTLLDATPLATDPGPLPPVPTGSYNIPATSFTDGSSACVANPKYSSTWQCMTTGYFPCNISEAPDGYNIELQPDHGYATKGSFSYGPQPPVLNKSSFALNIMLDKTSPARGPALFFVTSFDKLVIIPESQFPPVGSKRTANMADVADLMRRWPTWSQDAPPNRGDKPWFCWWNSTFLEFFLYVNEHIAASPASSGLSNYAPSPTRGSSSSSSYASTPTRSPTVPKASSSFLPAMENGDDDSNSQLVRRNNWTYPRIIKLEEKRLPKTGAQPYCDQMVVMDDGTLAGPFTHVPIQEIDPPSISTATMQPRAPLDSLNAGRLDERGIRDGSCFCQWVAT